jgi:uncharacterized protein (TIGR02757 family)
MSANSTSRASGGGSSRPLVGRTELELLYRTLNRREYVDPDPIGFLYRFDDLRDREVVGIVAASLAYGRVRQILASVARVLERLGTSPAEYLAAAAPAEIRESLDGFKHRFTPGEEVASLLLAVRRIQERSGSVGERFAALMGPDDQTVVPALGRLVGELRTGAFCEMPSVLPVPERGSACKRLHLFLRWMVRSDDVDPGGWDGVSPSKLVVPLDTHMHRIARAFGLTERAQANLGTALEITGSLREFCPEDPVKYDFAITRLGIRDDVTLESVLSQAGQIRPDTI